MYRLESFHFCIHVYEGLARHLSLGLLVLAYDAADFFASETNSNVIYNGFFLDE